jgi:acyl-CoA thioesterase I
MRADPTGAPGSEVAGPAAASAPNDDRPVVLFVGTSLTAGLGVDPDEAYPALVQRKIDAAGLRYRVVNAGVSGETSAGARARIGWLLRQPVAVLVLETGANDGLRGQDPDATRANIQAILDAARAQKPPPKLALVAMEALPNYGPEYGRRFSAVYPELARKNRATLVPFLLSGVAGDPTLNQPDGIHPTAEGHKKVAETVWKALRPIL